MTTIEQLAKLAELAPDMCQKDEFEYLIGGYIFWLASDGEFSARIPNVYCHIVGQPALDWLQCALQRVIEARGWEYRLELSQGLFFIQIWNRVGGVVPSASFSAASKTDVLLGALIKALEVKSD